MHARIRQQGIDEAVSVITVCRNAAGTIRRTIDSVLAQTVAPLEYIIIDGASTDETLGILRSYGTRITSIVSEPDKGISDAFNKGIARSGGGYIKLLNADDWLEHDAIERSLKAFRDHPEAGFVFGDLLEHNEESGGVTRVKGDGAYARWLPRVMGPLNHPTVTVRRDVYDRYGVFDDRWKLAMDYDWFLRVHRQGVAGVYDSSIVVHMTAGGRATAGRRKAMREVRDISIEHGYPRMMANGYYSLRLLKDLLLRMAGVR